MQRIPEPELMEDSEQALAYATADFDESDNAFVQRFIQLFSTTDIDGNIVDLGCGPGNIALRLAQIYPNRSVTGIDGAQAMLNIAKQRAVEMKLRETQVNFIHSILPDKTLSQKKYAGIVSNSLLHHLHNPSALWETIRDVSKPGAVVLIVDLRRPENNQKATRIVDQYAKNAPEILRFDFYNSLLAAFDVSEIESQLKANNLTNLKVRPLSDRYLEIFGQM